MQQRTALRRLFLLISLTALLFTMSWSTLVYRRESKHSGEPLPVLTLVQLATHPQTVPGYVHLQDVTPDFSKMVIEDHYCRSFRCVDHFVPLFDTVHPETQRVPVLSFVTTIPGDVNEARHPFNLHDPVIEGAVDTGGLSPNQVRDLRASGVMVDERTVVFERKALQGKVPPADGVDLTTPQNVA